MSYSSSEENRKLVLDQWLSFTEDVSVYSGLTEFAIVVPLGETIYLANIVGE